MSTLKPVGDDLYLFLGSGEEWDTKVRAVHPVGTDGQTSVSGGFRFVTAASFTRAANATPYASGQIVAPVPFIALQWPILAAAGGSAVMRRMLWRKSGTGLTAAAFRLHLSASVITPSNADGGVWLTDKRDDYLGSFDGTFARAFTDGAVAIASPSEGFDTEIRVPAGVTVFGSLEARGAYTPASGEVFSFVPIAWG